MPDVSVGHAVSVDFSVVVPQVALDALVVLVDVLVLAVSAVCVVPIALSVLIDVHVLAVPGVVDLLVDVPVPAVPVGDLVPAVVDVPDAVLVLDVPVHAVLVGVLVLAVVDVPVAVLVLAVLGVVDVTLPHPPMAISRVLVSMSVCKTPPTPPTPPTLEFVDSSHNDGQ